MLPLQLGSDKVLESERPGNQSHLMILAELQYNICLINIIERLYVPGTTPSAEVIREAMSVLTNFWSLLRSLLLQNRHRKALSTSR